MKKIYRSIASKVAIFRRWLNDIRKSKPQTFDKAVKGITFIIPFVACFAPALVTKNWIRAILEFIVLSFILIFQWSTYTNRIVEKDEIISKLNGELRIIQNEMEEGKAEISVLKHDAQEYADINEKNEYQRVVKRLNSRLDYLAGFSHIISDNVKKIVAEIEKPIDIRVVMKVTEFLQQSLSSLEMILTDYYGKNIRTSIKMTISEGKVKTYARGRNNIISRGGEYYCSQINQEEILIEKNYAYKAIVEKKRKYFAEGDLHKMHNKFKADDEFYCEYGEAYMNIFVSTIVMPIRIPVFQKSSPSHLEPFQDIIGMLCVDCKEPIMEWSINSLTERRAYHIIADYADSLAILMREYRDAS